MTTRAKELPRVLDLPGQDPNCLTCHPVKPGEDHHGRPLGLVPRTPWTTPIEVRYRQPP